MEDWNQSNNEQIKSEPLSASTILVAEDGLNPWPGSDSGNNPYKGKPFGKCNLCGRRYWDETQHKLTYHETGLRFKCQQCDKAFEKRIYLKSHVRRQHDHLKRFECNQCNGAFSTRSHLKRHSKIHSVERPFECEQCDKKFRLLQQLITHEVVHNRTIYTASLTKCKICGKGCRDIVTHMLEHSEERLFECDECHSTFKTKYNIASHMQIHINARSYRCTMCPQTFNFKTQLNRHLRTHSMNCPYQCEICGAGFKFANSLTVHKRRHTGEKPYKCDRCERSFTTNVSLRLHTRIHTGEKPYKCHICGRGFTDGSTMKIHFRVHTGENPYICHICGKTTKQASNLKSHYRHFHKINDITSKSIRSNARIFAKYSGEMLQGTPLMEILSREADKAVLSSTTLDQTDSTPVAIQNLVKNESLLNNFGQTSYGFSSEQNFAVGESNCGGVNMLSYSVDQLLKKANDHYLQQANTFGFAAPSLSINLTNLKPAENAEPNFPIMSFDQQSNENNDGKYGVCLNPRPCPPPVEVEDVKPIIAKISEKMRPTKSTQKKKKKPPAKTSKAKEQKNHQMKIEEIMIYDNYNTDDLYGRGSGVLVDNDSIVVKEETVEENFQWFISDDNVVQYTIKPELKKEEPLESTSPPTSLAPQSPQLPSPVVSLDVPDDDNKEDDPDYITIESLSKAKLENFVSDSSDEEGVTKSVQESAKSVAVASKPQSSQPATTSGKKYEKCNICNKRYLNHDDHMRKHTDTRPYECDICQKTFKLKDYLRLHVRMHTEEKNVICDQCGAAFHYNTDLRRHMRRHSNERPHQCTLCEKRFKDLATIRVHMRSHTGEKPFNCKLCEKTFSSSMGLKLHVRTHTGEKPYHCEYCGSRFCDNSTFKQHLRIHTGERPYKCHICGKGTTQAGNLKSHLRHYHKITVKNVNMTRDRKYTNLD